MMKRPSVWICLSAFFLCGPAFAQERSEAPWVVYEGESGPGQGKHVVFVSGDEEYRSEEALPMLAKILAYHHGFKTTVLFAIDPETGGIDPDHQTHIPGLHHLETADLMVLFTRFRELPDEQMKYIVDYTNSGKPVIGLRTATHPFADQENTSSPYAKPTESRLSRIADSPVCSTNSTTAKVASCGASSRPRRSAGAFEPRTRAQTSPSSAKVTAIAASPCGQPWVRTDR